MTRQKVKMTFIENESTRKVTFKKRKKGILKKAYELETLCGVPICVLINSSFDSNPEVWPSKDVANKLVAEWKNLSMLDKSKRMMNQKTFLEQRITKISEKYKKVRKENKDLEMKNLMSDCLNGKTLVSNVDKSHLRDFGSVIEQHLKEIDLRIEILKKKDEASSSSSFVSAATTPSDMPVLEICSSSVGFYDHQIENMEPIKKSELDLNKKPC